MKTLLRIVITGLVLTLSIEAASARVFVRGVPTCGEWAAAREREKELPGNAGERTWLLGFLSGLAIGQNLEFWGNPNAKALDNDSAYRWIDNYCRANPYKDLDDAGATLFIERTRIR